MELGCDIAGNEILGAAPSGCSGEKGEEQQRRVHGFPPVGAGARTSGGDYDEGGRGASQAGELAARPRPEIRPGLRVSSAWADRHSTGKSGRTARGRLQ